MAIPKTTDKNNSLSRCVFLHLWVRFCRLVVRIFYRELEVVGIENVTDIISDLDSALSS